MHAITFLPTKDLDAVHRFMEIVLPGSLTLDQGRCRIYGVGGGFWGFCESMTALPNPERVVLTIVMDDIAEFHDRLTRLGIYCDGKPRTNERFQIYHFYSEMPDGYRLEVQRFLHPFP